MPEYYLKNTCFRWPDFLIVTSINIVNIFNEWHITINRHMTVFKNIYWFATRCNYFLKFIANPFVMASTTQPKKHDAKDNYYEQYSEGNSNHLADNPIAVPGLACD